MCFCLGQSDLHGLTQAESDPVHVPSGPERTGACGMFESNIAAHAVKMQRSTTMEAICASQHRRSMWK